MSQGEAQLAAVKEYIAKYNLEEELSAGVNLAIKQNSDDPFRVISDYLRSKAKDLEDEYSDDDEDQMDAAEMEEMEKRMAAKRAGGGGGRRQQVVAKAFEVPDHWTPPNHAKPPEEEEFLKETMKTNKLMKSLTPSDRDQLMRAFKKVEFATDVKVITQGDAGDKATTFYIMYSGSCNIDVSGKVVMKAEKGIAFGELALLHNAARAATVTAAEPVTAFELDEVSFKMILMGKSKQDAKDYVEFLGAVPILKSLSPAGIGELAGCLKEAEFEPGKLIIGEGDEGNHFFIIRDGEVKVTKMGSDAEVSRRLVRGDFFGELALLSADRRQASVTAVKATTVLMVSRAEFTRMLGSLSDLIAASTSYDK